MNEKIKKRLIMSIPYVIIGLFGTKVGLMWRLADGTDVMAHFMDMGRTFYIALEKPLLPSFHPFDLLIGAAIAVIIRAIVYGKSKNAKKYRKDVEYGSARCGA